jgi:hypothetical protein
MIHLCPNYLLDKCDSGVECHYGHDLRSEHNLPLLSAFELDGLSRESLKGLLLLLAKRQVLTVPLHDFPSVCDDYNGPNGCRVDHSICPK